MLLFLGMKNKLVNGSKMIKIIIILSLGVATYFVSSSKNDTLRYVVYTSAVIGTVSTLLVGHKK